eukprot:scaffold1900_cov389-Prasinococcus_capsulatus_cf.AAC.8
MHTLPEQGGKHDVKRRAVPPHRTPGEWPPTAAGMANREVGRTSSSCECCNATIYAETWRLGNCLQRRWGVGAITLKTCVRAAPAVRSLASPEMLTQQPEVVCHKRAARASDFASSKLRELMCVLGTRSRRRLRSPGPWKNYFTPFWVPWLLTSVSLPALSRNPS